MNRERALDAVRYFLSLLDESLAADDARNDLARSTVDRKAREQIPLMERIAAETEPGVAYGFLEHSVMGEWGWFDARAAAQRLEAVLAGAGWPEIFDDEVEERLRPTSYRRT